MRQASATIRAVSGHSTPKFSQRSLGVLRALVDLNHLRATEEAKGKIRYLRPDYQDPDKTQTTPSAASPKS
jgi:hypothetical protein